MALQRAVYRPRDAEHTVLHQVVAEHLEAFLRAVAEAGDGAGLPQFVEGEFREFLTCGVFEGGVARFRCEDCALEHLVPFSCKGRGFCPSCGRLCQVLGTPFMMPSLPNFRAFSCRATPGPGR